MNKKVLQVALLAAMVLLIQQVSMAQPPPPHPGGSGNQGAPITEAIALLGIAGATVATRKMLKK